jgi:lipopolysaccharide export system protein LptC
MSEAAVRERADKQRWAVPGSAHDRIVRWSKIVLPSAVGRADRDPRLRAARQAGDVSFILDKKKVEKRPSGCGSRPRATSAPTTRARSSNHRQRAIQRSSDVPIVDIEGMFARLASPTDR